MLLPAARTHPAPPPVRRVLNVAHRGASDAAPENTLAAVRAAVAVGAHLVELDVQRSSDGALMVIHDATLARTTDAARVFPRRAPWRVGDFTHDELKRLDAGGWMSPAFRGETIPTLGEVIAALQRESTGLLLEVKGPERHPGIVRHVASALREQAGYLDAAVASRRLVVQSFGFAAMKEHKTLEPSVPVGLLGTPERVNLPALASWADQVNPSHLAVDGAYVDEVHRLGMECLVWTVNRGPAMRRVLRLGVDGVITNRPRRLGQLLADGPRDRHGALTR